MILDQHAELDFYSASSLKQQFAGRHIAPLGHIILIPSQPVCYCVLSGEATNTNFKVFGLTRPGLEPTIYRTRGEHANHYATDVVYIYCKFCFVIKVCEDAKNRGNGSCLMGTK